MTNGGVNPVAFALPLVNLSPVTAPRTGYFTETYRSAVDDSEQPFAVWVPRAYTSRRAWPLVVALHGMDGDERMIPEQCFQMHTRGFREDVIFVSPFGRGDIGFRYMGEVDFWDVINWVKARYRVDARRQYLTGLSMGGYATWRLACKYPEQWAAIAPVCGGGSRAKLKALEKIPVWCVHGDADDIVTVEHSRRLVAELKRLKFSVRYDELPRVGHNSWDWLYDPRRKRYSLVDWFLKFRKSHPAPRVERPLREGGFKDLFHERVIISHPAASPIPRETELLRAEAVRIAEFCFGDYPMKSGRLIVKSDAELSRDDLASANHLMLGRSDNHAWLARLERKLLARHVKGRLHVRGEPWLGKTLLAATCQPSPWNKDRLLGVITYQQFHQMRGAAEKICGWDAEPLHVNVFDAQQGKFILRESLGK